MFHMVRRGSSAIKISRVEITFILDLSNWLEQLVDEGGEKTEVPKKKNPDGLQKMPLTNIRKFKSHHSNTLFPTSNVYKPSKGALNSKP